MFEPSLIVVVIFASVYALAGAILGMLSGWLTALALKFRYKPKLNAAIGAMGFLLGGLISIAMPWHTNTISYELSGGTEVTSTMNSYQHPERVALITAICLPILYGVWRRFLRMGE